MSLKGDKGFFRCVVLPDGSIEYDTKSNGMLLPINMPDDGCVVSLVPYSLEIEDLMLGFEQVLDSFYKLKSASHNNNPDVDRWVMSCYNYSNIPISLVGEREQNIRDMVKDLLVDMRTTLPPAMKTVFDFDKCFRANFSFECITPYKMCTNNIICFKHVFKDKHILFVMEHKDDGIWFVPFDNPVPSYCDDMLRQEKGVSPQLLTDMIEYNFRAMQA